METLLDARKIQQMTLEIKDSYYFVRVVIHQS